MSQERKRPFYSIVVPCYNSRKTIGTLLQSIVDQELEKQDIQVILADDCSTEPYDDVVEPFENRLWIDRTKTEYNFCPGNTREAGAQKAIGEWLCFSDHDDEFVAGALKQLKNALENDEKIKEQDFAMISTSFVHVDPYNNDEVLQIHPGNDPGKGWTHGNFYSLDKLWKKYDLHYKKDLTSHEDIYMFSLINSLRALEPFQTLMIQGLVTYKWKRWKGSESNKHILIDGVDREFLEVYFIDYAIATGEVYYDLMMQKPDVNNAIRECIFSSLVWYYFYVEGFFFHQGNKYMLKNIEYLQDWLDRIERDLGITLEEVWAWLCSHTETWMQIYQKSIIATGYIIPSYSFLDFYRAIKSRQRLIAKRI